MATQTSRIPRCDNHPPFSALMRCEACKTFLCRLCVKSEGDRSVCKACGGSCVPASGEELHQVAERQTQILRKRESEILSGAAVPPPPPPPAPPGKGTLAALRAGKSADSMPAQPVPASAAAPAPAAAVTATAEQPAETLPPPSFRKGPPYFCKNHRDKKATRVCDVCRDEFCDECKKMIEENPRCMECGAQLQLIPPDEQGFPPIPMSKRIAKAFRFPIKGDGKLMLVLGGLFLGFASFEWKCKAAVLGYMYAYLMKICRTSAIGRETPPDWPSSEDYFGISFFVIAKILSIVPAILFLLIMNVNILAFMLGADGDPDTSYQTTSQEDEGEGDNPEAPPRRHHRVVVSRGYGLHITVPYYVLSALGAVYLPMAILACVLFRTKEALNPLFVFSSIAKVRSDYIPAYLIMLFAEFAVGIGALSSALIPIAGTVIAAFIWLYLMMVQMHVMGELYMVNRNKLNWFGRKQEQEEAAA